MRTAATVYYASILLAMVLCYLAPTNVGWSLSLLATGWIGGLSFAVLGAPRRLFALIRRLP